MRLPKISRNPNTNWENNGIQFPRLIAELMDAGAFSASVKMSVAESMDLSVSEVEEIAARAHDMWDTIKASI